MSTAFWTLGAAHPVDQHPDAVRSTVEPVRTDGPAEIRDAADWNQAEFDGSGQLVGLTPRQLAGDVHESVQFAPFWSALATQDHEHLIDDQVATAGTAADREAAGAFGRGTAEWTEGIEPQIRDGSAFGNDYFLRDGAPVQEGAGTYMAPYVADIDWQGVGAALYADRSRQAYQATLVSSGMGQA